MYKQEENEMTDEEINERYRSVIDAAIVAFATDTNYAADVVKKAKTILARQAKKEIVS